MIANVIVPVVTRLGIAAVWLWCALALVFFPLVPRPAGAALAIAFTVAAILLFRRQQFPQAARHFCVMSLLVLLAWSLVRPSHHRAWSPTQAVLPSASIDGEQVTIFNIRRTTYADDGSYDIQHYDGTFDLSDLESVWFGVQHFALFKGVAHTFVSFGFGDGRYLAISVESRRREAEGFSALAGLFKQYGLIYIVGDEREVIGQRSLQGEAPIYLYPIRSNAQQRREMFLSMLRHANRLRDAPQFYNSLTNNCTTNIVEHFNKIAPQRIFAYSPRILLPGYTGEVAYENGLIATEEPFAAFKQKALINDLAKEAAQSADFSTKIRQRMKRSQ